MESEATKGAEMKTYRIHDAHTNHVLDNGKTYTLKAAQQRMAALDRRSNIVLSFYLTRA